MLKRLLLCVCLMTATGPAAAVNYTDIWYLPTESGWGVNVVQSDTFMFMTFFIYGPDRKPIWYSAQLFQDSKGNFNGSLYTSTGTFYGSTWNPPDQQTGSVGSVSFQPSSPTAAKLTYTVTTPAALAATVTKTVQRQTLTPISMAGTYLGAESGAYSACSSTANNSAYTDKFTLQLTQASAASATLQFSYESGLSCTFTGTLVQYGQMYTIPTGTFNCSDNTGYQINTTGTMSQLRPTALGLEGTFTATDAGGGCQQNATFGGPRQ